MTKGLVRYRQAGCFHSIAFSCYRRLAHPGTAAARSLFERSLEKMRRRYDFVVCGYLKNLLKAVRPPDHVVQWPSGLAVEDVAGWILGSEENLVPVIQAEMPTAPASIKDIVRWLKTSTKEKKAKTDFLAYKAIATAVLSSATAKSRVRKLLDALVNLTSGNASSNLLLTDTARGELGHLRLGDRS